MKVRFYSLGVLELASHGDSISGDPEKADSKEAGRSQAIYKFAARGR